MAIPRPQILGLASLLALAPVLAYQLSLNQGLGPWLSVVCVLLISGSVFVMLSPTEGGHDGTAS